MPGRPSLQPSFGVVLRRRRHAAGLSQEALAELAGLTAVYISNLETGKRVPTIDAVWALAMGLHCQGWELLKESEAVVQG